MKLLIFAFAMFGVSTSSFAATCKDGSVLKLACSTPNGIGQASGYPVAMAVCEKQNSMTMIFDIKDSAQVVQDGVTKKRDEQNQATHYSSVNGELTADLFTSQGLTFVRISRQGANMGFLQCR